jgi:hypothetical protein
MLKQDPLQRGLIGGAEWHADHDGVDGAGGLAGREHHIEHRTEATNEGVVGFKNDRLGQRLDPVQHPATGGRANLLAPSARPLDDEQALALGVAPNRRHVIDIEVIQKQ